MRDRQAPPALTGDALLEIAHLQCTWRVTRGAAHTLNNALTALIGLAAEPEEAELAHEVDRCTRVARNLTAHHAARFGRSQESELGAVLRSVAPILEDTLSSRFGFETQAPADLLCLEADPAELEMMVLLLTYRLADLCRGSGRLRLAMQPGEKPDSACVQIDLEAADLPPDAADQVLNPATVADTGPALALEAVHAVAARCGGSLEAVPCTGGVRVRARLPATLL